MIRIGAVGKLVRGDVLDVSKSALEEKLRDYDPQLYLRWNPNKLRGHGCWELRRCPEKKTAVYQGTFEGVPYYRLEEVELDIVNHVLDLPYLNYSVLTKLKAIDTWQDKRWADHFESREAEHREQLKAKARAEMLYNMRQNKSAIRDFKEALLSGVNPALLAHYWDQSGG